MTHRDKKIDLKEPTDVSEEESELELIQEAEATAEYMQLKRLSIAREFNRCKMLRHKLAQRALLIQQVKT